MENYCEGEIKKLQDSLSLIRNAGGWSMEDFADLLDVSKQTICNLESGTTKMSRIQYIAIRSILDYKINENPDNKLFISTVNLCLNSDSMKEEDIDKVKAFVSGSQKSKLDYSIIAKGVAALAGISLVALDALASPDKKVSTSWINKFMKNSK